MDGMDLLRTVKTLSPQTPVILISGLYELALAIDALKNGAADYLLKPATPRDVVRLVTLHLNPQAQNGQQAMRSAIAKFLRVRQGHEKNTYDLEEIFQTLGFRRFETLQHSHRVSGYAESLGRLLGIEGSPLEHLKLGAMLHDIGKIAIPHNVLMKPAKLNDAEWTVMKMHPRIGWELMSEFHELTAEAEIVYAHHESFDGRGYPRALAGEEIPLGARIFAIADTFDAITSDRPYRKGQSFDVARSEIESKIGTQFDPRVVREFLKVPAVELKRIGSQYPDLEAEP
jgi:putative nucleotidyltransferase with HDIG domain